MFYLAWKTTPLRGILFLIFTVLFLLLWPLRPLMESISVKQKETFFLEFLILQESKKQEILSQVKKMPGVLEITEGKMVDSFPLYKILSPSFVKMDSLELLKKYLEKTYEEKIIVGPVQTTKEEISVAFYFNYIASFMLLLCFFLLYNWFRGLSSLASIAKNLTVKKYFLFRFFFINVFPLFFLNFIYLFFRENNWTNFSLWAIPFFLYGALGGYVWGK